MAHAYTPGLIIAEEFHVRKERRLPIKGQVVVFVAGKVKAEDVVARTQLPGDVEPLNIAGILGVPPSDVPQYLLKKPGDPIKKDEVIAEIKSFFGLFKTQVKSPIDGIFESYSTVTGQAMLRHPPMLVEITAYIDGVVTEVFENEGVAVETDATFIQGIFGVGGETTGILKRVADKPSDVITAEDISEDVKGKILIGGALVTADALKKAAKLGAKGFVTGGIDSKDLREFLGYDIGVAITGKEKIGLTLVVTEGFSRMTMMERTFKLLCQHEGKKASMNGATQIRAGVIRPEVVVPLEEVKPKKEKAKIEQQTGIDIGTRVRIIREPYFGKMGKVVALPPELKDIETESKVRVLEVELDTGERITLPRANVEIIQE